MSNGDGPVSPRRFRIAFSFAGEKRDFVEKTAQILARRFGKNAILYDEFHEPEFAIYDLGIRLPKLYGEQSDLIIPVICPNYDQKRWTGWEWVHIYGLLTKEAGHRVMPSRFDYATVDGLSPACGFIELDHKSPEEFATLILKRLARNESKPEDYYCLRFTPETEPAQRTSIPHNLPTLQPFFGREDELKKIVAALDPDDRGWGALIDGPGGMGKTSLAVRAAYDASPEDFKRVVFVTLKSRELDDNGVTDLSGFLISGLAELFNELSRELGHSDIAKAPDDQRPRLLINALRGTQTLLVLDNLESLTKPERDRLFTFIRKLPQGCKAILTSRGRIGSGAEELILEKLSQDAALETLAELARHNPHLAKTSEAERIVLYTQTSGKPLLLRWTAGQLGRGHCLTFTDALHFLRSCPAENDPLEFIFGDLVNDFTSEETCVLSALTHFTLPAKTEHVAEISQCSVEKASRALRSLSVRSLAVPNNESNTFTLVPLVADFLRKKNPAIVTETGDWLEKHVFATIVKNGYQKYDCFPTLNASWAMIAASLPRFLIGPNDRLQLICHALQYFLNFTGRWDEQFALAHEAEKCATAAGDFLNAGWRAYDAGWVHRQRGQSTEVIAHAERAASHWQKANGGAHERATATRLRGVGYQLANDHTAAIVAYREAVEIWRTLRSESSDIVIGLNALAQVEFDSDDFDTAEQDFREALKIARAIGFDEGIATCVGNLAVVAGVRNDWADAEALAREALSLSEALGRQELIAVNCRSLARALVRQRRKSEARPYAQRAVEICTQLNARVDLALEMLSECEN